MKTSSECSTDFFKLLVNEFLSTGKFPSNFKLADITPIHKKKLPQAKKNCRTVSVILVISEKIMQKQINSYIFDYSPLIYADIEKASARNIH